MPELEVKTVGSTTIYVNDEGKFFAEIDGEEVFRVSLRSLERLIEQRLSPLSVMIVERSWNWRVRKDEITRTTKYKLKGKHGSYDSFDAVYLYSESAAEELEKLLAEYIVLCEKWDIILEDLIRVTPKNFERLRNDQGGS